MWNSLWFWRHTGRDLELLERGRGRGTLWIVVIAILFAIVVAVLLKVFLPG